MEKTFSAGSIILEKNSVSSFLYVIVRGKVKFEFHEKTFFLTDNDFFGEECVFLKKISPYTAIASEETVVQIFDYQEAKEHIIKNPKMFFALFVRNISRVWESFEPISVNNRIYIGFIEKILPLVKKADCVDPIIELPISLENLASELVMESDKLSSFIISVEHLGHIRLGNNGKIYTVGRETFYKLTIKYYKNRYFGPATGVKGCGLSPLINLFIIKEKEIFGR